MLDSRRYIIWCKPACAYWCHHCFYGLW